MAETARPETAEGWRTGAEREALTKDWDEHLELETLSFLQEAQGLVYAVLNDGLGWCSPKEGSLHFGSQWLLPGRIITGFRGLERCGETLSSSTRIQTEEDLLEFFHHDLTKVLQRLEGGGQLRSEEYGECHWAALPRPATHPFSTPPSPHPFCQQAMKLLGLRTGLVLQGLGERVILSLIKCQLGLLA